MKSIFFAIAILVFSVHKSSSALEMVIGEEHISPGVEIIFEGAVKDHVVPLSQNLAEQKTDVHIEARINWSSTQPVPIGTPRGGFIPYLSVNVEIINQRTHETSLITLTPHINLIDNFHYARNIKLPGKTDDLYTVTFFIDPPEKSALSLHHDWIMEHGDSLFKAVKFSYKNQNFEAISKATRKK